MDSVQSQSSVRILFVLTEGIHSTLFPLDNVSILSEDSVRSNLNQVSKLYFFSRVSILSEDSVRSNCLLVSFQRRFAMERTVSILSEDSVRSNPTLANP